MMINKSAKFLIKKILRPQNVRRINTIRASLKRIRRRRFQILIDTTNGCNLNCSFCSRNNTKITQMTTPEFITILSKIHTYTHSLQLSCAWEYSIAKNAPEIVKALGEYHIPHTTIYTNGNLLWDYLAETIIESGLEKFVISIGEVEKESYERIRKGGKFERVLTNIRKLDTLKKAKNTRYPRLCANLTLINSNINELVDFVDLAHSLGIEEIRGRHLILNTGINMDHEIIRDKAEANRIIEAASKKATQYGMNFFVPSYSEQIAPKQCRAPWEQLYIASNGEVSVCPRIHLYVPIGNIIEQDLKRIIRSQEMKKLRNQFCTGNFNNPVCTICLSNQESEIPIKQGF